MNGARLQSGLARQLVAVIAAALAACAPLPDMQRGQQALASGDLLAAESDLRPLAERGYLLAQVRLAKAYREQGSPESLKQAAHWYRQAMRRDPAYAVDLARALAAGDEPEALVEAADLLRNADLMGDSEALKLLIRLYREHPELDTRGQTAALLARAAQRQDRDSQAAVIRWYRDFGSTHAHREELFQRCLEARDWVPKCYVDLAEIYRAGAAWPKLDGLLEELVQRHQQQWVDDEILARVARSLMDDEIPQAAQPAAATQLLARLQGRSAEAQAELAELLLDHPDLGAELEPPLDPLTLLEQAAEGGSADAALTLGRLVLHGRQGLVADPRRAQKLLQQAAQTLPAAHYSLGRMYQRGQLGESHPELALQHLLLAARAGYARADLELARLYSRAQGVRPDPVTAAAFAHLASLSGIGEASGLKQQLQARMNVDQQMQAEALAQREFSVRQAGASETLSTQDPGSRSEPANAEFAAMEDAS